MNSRIFNILSCLVLSLAVSLASAEDATTPGKVVRVGNAALAGARAMLLSHEMRTAAEEVAASIEHTKPNER